jgi:hypothetical protein
MHGYILSASDCFRGEIELKLLVADDRLADFNAAPIIATNARNKGTRNLVPITTR